MSPVSNNKTFTTVLHVTLGGAPLPDALAKYLTGGWVDASLNVPSAFELTFSDPNGKLTEKYASLKVGAPAVLAPFADGKRGEPLLTGEVTAIEVEGTPGQGRSLVLRGYDLGHRMLRNRRVEGYPNMTASDIVRKLAALNRVPIGKVEATQPVYELATQPNTTDWDFLSRLARENDKRLALDGKGKLTFAELPAASGGSTELKFGDNTLHCRVAMTAAGQVQKVDVRGWDPKTKRPLSAPTPSITSKEIVAGTTPAELTKTFGKAELTATRTPFTTQSQVTQAAKALADDVTGSFAEVEVAVNGNPKLMPGEAVKVTSAGKPFDGSYTATSVRHVFVSGRQYQTHLVVSGRQFRSLYGTASGGGEPAPAMPGVAVALVTNIKDPLKQNRVKLRFPWLSATYESDWCRVAQLGGKGGGGLMMPDVNDEVLCAFDRGSLEHPYVLAGLYNGVDKHTPATDGVTPVDPMSGKVQWRALTSRAGHTIELREKGAKTGATTGIRLRTGKGKLSIEMNEARTTLTIDSSGTVTIKGGRGVVVESGMDLSLIAKGLITMRAGMGVNVTTPTGRINVVAGLGIDVKGAKFKVTAAQSVINSPSFITSMIPIPNPAIANLPI
ncbi:VgrG-related protein [Streptomyces sp. NPDC050504]|uniref:VgrG-related protein n=1 Tax=Streptomyces sp. NPDC050504 TaxID=3365618 RepID=UPI0037BCD600